MAGKARVHELAKELGVTSKEVLARLSDQGEFVKSASSTVEAPVARRLRESFGGAKPAAEKVKADGNGSPAKPAAKATREAGGTQAGSARQSPRPPRRLLRRLRPLRLRRSGTGRAPGRTGCRHPAQRPVPGPARHPSPPRGRRASATTRSPRSSRSTGRFRVRRHPVRVPRAPVRRDPACRRAICLRVLAGPGPLPRGRPGGAASRSR